MNIVVGSQNPVKIKAVRTVTKELWPKATIAGCDAPSGVSEQPFSDKETMQGALNRAVYSLKKAGGEKLKKAPQLHQDFEKSRTADSYLGIGLEGGVFTSDHTDSLWSTVWVAVCDSTGFYTLACGARFHIPHQLQESLHDGAELGPLMAKLIDEKDVRKKQGMIGVLTNNVTSRTESYTQIAREAIGLWSGRFWADGLQ